MGCACAFSRQAPDDVEPFELSSIELSSTSKNSSVLMSQHPGTVTIPQYRVNQSELELSDSDSSVASILGVCLNGFDGDALMSDVEEAQDDIQVGAAAGVNNPSDMTWRTTGWSAGREDLAKTKEAKRAGSLAGKTVTSNQHGAALSENDVQGPQGGGGLGVETK